MGTGGYDNRESDLYQLAGVTQMNVLHNLMSRRNIMTLMIYWILESRVDHMKWLPVNDDTFQSDELSS
jgi:hypothetical protein